MTISNCQNRVQDFRDALLAGGRVERFTLVFDEFDKLLESYRKGLEPEVNELANQLRRAATEDKDIGVVLAGSDLMKRIVGEYRHAWYGSAQEIVLPHFDGQDSREEAQEIVAPNRLAKRRIFESHIIDEAIRITGGHPLYLRLLGLVASHISKRQRVGMTTLRDAAKKSMRPGEVLHGELPDMRDLLKSSLQALQLMPSEFEEELAHLLLLKLAKHTSLEQAFTPWGALVNSDELNELLPKSDWGGIRAKLASANLIVRNDRGWWGFKVPLMGEALRTQLDLGFETRFEKARALKERRE